MQTPHRQSFFPRATNILRRCNSCLRAKVGEVGFAVVHDVAAGEALQGLLGAMESLVTLDGGSRGADGGCCSDDGRSGGRGGGRRIQRSRRRTADPAVEAANGADGGSGGRGDGG